MTTVWLNMEINLATKLKALAGAAGLSEAEIAMIHEVSNTTYENLAALSPGQLKAMMLVVQAQILESGRADRNEQLLAVKTLVEENPNAEIRSGFVGLRDGITSLASMLDARTFISLVTKFSGEEKPGKEEKFRQWLRQIDRIGALKGLGDAAMKDLCTSTLVLNAADYCARVISTDKNIAWADLRALLYERYSGFTMNLMARRSLRNIKQNTGESIQNLSERIIQAADLAYTPEQRKDKLCESELIDILAGAVLDLRILRKFIDKRPKTFGKAVEVALSVQNSEAIYQVFQHKQGNTKTKTRIEQPMEVSVIRKSEENNAKINMEQTNLVNGLVQGQKQTSTDLRNLAYQMQNVRQSRTSAVLRELNSKLLPVERHRSKAQISPADDEAERDQSLAYAYTPRGPKEHPHQRRERSLESKGAPRGTSVVLGKFRGDIYRGEFMEENHLASGRGQHRREPERSCQLSSSGDESEETDSPEFYRRVKSKSPRRRNGSPFVRGNSSKADDWTLLRQEDLELARCFRCHKEGHREAYCKELSENWEGGEEYQI